MDHPITAIYDANVLYPAPIRDLFLRIAQSGLVFARWTEMIHDEWVRNLLENNPKLNPESIARTRRLMNEAVRDCLLTGYEGPIPVLFASWRLCVILCPRIPRAVTPRCARERGPGGPHYVKGPHHVLDRTT
jgi:hypothetical protein